MNRKRSRLENMFPIEVHRSSEVDRESVVREEYEPQESTPKQVIGMSFGEEKNINFIFSFFMFNSILQF